MSLAIDELEAQILDLLNYGYNMDEIEEILSGKQSIDESV